MKKFILVAAVAFAFTACNSGVKTETTTDSTVVKADTTVVADSTKVVDTVKAAK